MMNRSTSYILGIIGIATLTLFNLLNREDDINVSMGGTSASLRHRILASPQYDDYDDNDDDNGNNDEIENEIIFVAIVAAILMCGCGCLSGTCSQDNMRDTRLGEPLMSRDDQRTDIFSNSLSGEENEWLCPVCAFENRPRANQCTLCGASRGIAARYYDNMRKNQKDALEQRSSIASDDDFRVSMVAPKFSQTRKSGNARSSMVGRESALSGEALSQGERQKAFMVRRFNELTLRQRAAHRRRLWQRRAVNANGDMEWVRVSVAPVGSQPEGNKGGGGGLTDSLLPPEDVNNDTFNPLISQPADYLLPASKERDSFGDSSHISFSPGFTSVLNIESPGELDWQEVRGTKTESVGPIKQRIISMSKEKVIRDKELMEGGTDLDTDSTRSSIPNMEIENNHDLIYIASLPFRRKQQWLQSFLDSMRANDVAIGQPTSGVVKVQVRRENLLGDSFSQIMSLDPTLLARRLRIVFVDEPGIDAGGLLREWCTLITQQLFDPQFGLFYLQGNDAGYTINPISGLCNGLHLKYFRFAGRFIGKAILEHQTIPAHLSLPLLKHVLSVPISFSDLEFVDGELYQNLVYLRDNPGAEHLDLDFTVEVEHLGMRQTHELVPGGVNIAVTDANKMEYLNYRFKFRMLDSISPQLWQLLCGLYEVVPREVLSVFDYQELELLISGVPEIDFDDWKRHSRYVGLYKKLGPEHPVIVWFWQVVQEFTHEERARLLQFTTGTTRVPAQGFKALEANDGNFRLFTLSGVSKTDFLFPRAHTCFNRIDLPLYDSKDELERYLTLVINMEITGFSDE